MFSTSKFANHYLKEHSILIVVARRNDCEFSELSAEQYSEYSAG
jgi:hypothetical protein